MFNLSYIIINACSEGNIELLQKYLDDKNSGGDAIDLNKGDYDRRTPLHLASAEGHLDIVKYLLDRIQRTLATMKKVGVIKIMYSDI